MAIWWITEAIPISVTALLPIILFPLSGGLELSETTASFGHKYVFLYLGGFIIAIAIQKWNLHKRIALNIISFIGTDVNATGLELPLQDGTGEFTYTLSHNAKNTDITILDSKGAVILNAQGSLKAGTHEFKWDGKDNYGNKMADGAYTINITPMDFDEQIISSTVAIKAHVTGVNMSSGTTMLEAGDVSIPLDKILAIKEARSASAAKE